MVVIGSTNTIVDTLLTVRVVSTIPTGASKNYDIFGCGRQLTGWVGYTHLSKVLSDRALVGPVAWLAGVSGFGSLGVRPILKAVPSVL